MPIPSLWLILLIFNVFYGTVTSVLYRVYSLNTGQQAIIINEHNRLRRQEGGADMQEMVWDANLATMAYNHASTCSASHTTSYQRSNTAGFRFIGENIWWSTEQSLRTDLASVIRDFYNEKPYYNYNSASCQWWQVCGHYTAVVWASTCAVGCAASYCNGIYNGRGINYGHIIICNYGPGGNARGQQPFRWGQACSACPAGGCNNGLCATQCQGYRYSPSVQQPVRAIPQKAVKPQAIQQLRGTCADYNNDCDFWARRDECRLNPSYMLDLCKKSCGLCNGNSIPQTTPAPPIAPSSNVGDCTDRSFLCPFWASIGECSNNSQYMLRNCYRSCNSGTCGQTSRFDVPNFSCNDDNTSCGFWSEIGECTRNADWMQWKCRKSCGLC